MNLALRRLAITVSERRKGGFFWEILEQDAEEQWTAIEAQENTVPTYAQAMAAGLIHLESLVEDLDGGPRQAEPPQASSRPSRGADVDVGVPEQKASVKSRSRPGSAFGFGPLR